MRYFLFFVIIITTASSCFLFSKFKKDSFLYHASGQPSTLPLILPRGGSAAVIQTDSAGNRIQTYNYAGGATWYIAQMRDTSTMLHNIDSSQHIPEVHTSGSIMYKGITPQYTFWREVKNGYLRIGYRNVTVPVEPRFDSAVNYALKITTNLY